jgi:cGMP-dependent protein kinase
VRKGEFGDSFFVVQKGEVVINLETSFKRLGRGHCFGERAFLRKTQRRTATVQASTDVDLLVIDTLSFEGYLGDLGLYINQLDNLTQDEEVTLADLEILTEIGVGQYGRVKLVKSKKTGATYAMKCLEKRKVKALGQVVHVRNEKQIMAQLDHPFIVKLVSTCKDAVQVCWCVCV